MESLQIKTCRIESQVRSNIDSELKQGKNMMELNELPGAELILPGLDDVRQGKTKTVGALLIAIAFTRLSQAGEIPEHQRVEEPELTLYAFLEDTRGVAH